eukprot:TRINITY_DN12821_c1_g2_i1.p1 TRINITY_DN12821_c1_g2~~TRINITY_DN12821_c1_g2_i1.p1  ORF type:complete len:819 (+),score=100.78 TRINITY_DN12821_c1_g2_i1:39-2495(+)
MRRYLRYVMPALMLVATLASTVARGQVTALFAALGTLATVSFLLGERLCSAQSSLGRLHLIDYCVFALFSFIWLFAFGVSHLVYPMHYHSEACTVAVYLCVVLYAGSKVSCYAFLVEKVHVVTLPHLRHRDDLLWRCNVLILLPYAGVLVTMLKWPVAEHRSHDNYCTIGLQLPAAVSLAGYDLCFTVYVTGLFLRPVLAMMSDKVKQMDRESYEEDRAVAIKTFCAAVVTVVVSFANICSLAVFHHGYSSDLCLVLCLSDAFVNALVVDYMADVMKDLRCTALMAVDLAEAVASLDLERLEYLRQLEHPTRVQAAFAKISSLLVEYRRYLPDALTEMEPAHTPEATATSPTHSRRESTCSTNSAASQHQPHTTNHTLASASGAANVLVVQPSASPATTSFMSAGPSLDSETSRRPSDSGGTRQRPTQQLEVSCRLADVTVLVIRCRPWEGHFALTGGIADPGVAVSTLQRFVDVVVTTVRDHRGVVAQWSGDAVVCHWGARRYVANRAQRALDCTWQLLCRLEERLGVNSAQISVGIASGEVVCGSIGNNQLRSFALCGHASDHAHSLRYVSELDGCRALVDRRTAEAAGYYYKLRLVDVVNTTSGIVEAFELLGPVVRAENEWMYQLARDCPADVEWIERWNVAAKNLFEGRCSEATTQLLLLARSDPIRYANGGCSSPRCTPAEAGSSNPCSCSPCSPFPPPPAAKSTVATNQSSLTTIASSGQITTPAPPSACVAALSPSSSSIGDMVLQRLLQLLTKAGPIPPSSHLTPSATTSLHWRYSRSLLAKPQLVPLAPETDAKPQQGKLPLSPALPL